MTTNDREFEIFLVAAPGLEKALWAEARGLGFKSARYGLGGVTMKGTWPDVWRANLELRGAGRILARIDSFRVLHLSQLDKRARNVDWARTLRRDVPFRVEVTCKKSRIYHSGAAAERIERAVREELGAPHSDDAEILIKARIENDICTVSFDTSGELLHKRGHKEAVNKAPMRETMAALFLRLCSFDGKEPVLDPMCGSGTFVIEAAEIAAGLKPGRSRSFAFELFSNFDPAAWQELHAAPAAMPAIAPTLRFYGSDRDPGAIRMSRDNAERAGVGGFTQFDERDVREIVAPEGPPGLVIVNPPYGDRIGDKHRLAALYRTLGQSLKTKFRGWRVGLIATDDSLARATGLRFEQPVGPISHGGLRIFLYQSGPLP